MFIALAQMKNRTVPYISKSRRTTLDEYLIHLVADGYQANPLSVAGPQNCGELNYCLTTTCLRYDRAHLGSLETNLFKVAAHYFTAKPLSYQRINDLIGAGACAVLEIGRRCPGTKKFEILALTSLCRRAYAEFAVAYENQKIVENGDITEFKR